MSRKTRKIAIFGSTGSIGRSALEVAAAPASELEIVALSAHRQLPQLVEQARRWRPSYVVAVDDQAARHFDWSGLPAGTNVLFGQQGMEQVARLPEVDVVLAAVVGSIGLLSTWAALE